VGEVNIGRNPGSRNVAIELQHDTTCKNSMNYCPNSGTISVHLFFNESCTSKENGWYPIFAIPLQRYGMEHAA
jgi:hypothetical protein